jgi:hypothetical protein
MAMLRLEGKPLQRGVMLRVSHDDGLRSRPIVYIHVLGRVLPSTWHKADALDRILSADGRSSGECESVD